MGLGAGAIQKLGKYFKDNSRNQPEIRTYVVLVPRWFFFQPRLCLASHAHSRWKLIADDMHEK